MLFSLSVFFFSLLALFLLFVLISVRLLTSQILALVTVYTIGFIKDKKVKDWKKQNPNDPVNQYL